MEAADQSGSDFIEPVKGTIICLYGGIVFLKTAWGELKDRVQGPRKGDVVEGA